MRPMHLKSHSPRSPRSPRVAAAMLISGTCNNETRKHSGAGGRGLDAFATVRHRRPSALYKISRTLSVAIE
jgi:hypothetical protein